MNILVANLPETTSEHHIMELFRHFGQVNAVQIIMSNETGRSKMFAFVEMSVREDGEAAISRLNNMNFMGCYIEVTEVRQKPDS